MLTLKNAGYISKLFCFKILMIVSENVQKTPDHNALSEMYPFEFFFISSISRTLFESNVDLCLFIFMHFCIRMTGLVITHDCYSIEIFHTLR